MITISNTQTRATLETPFFGQAFPEISADFATYAAGHPGIESLTIELSADQLSVTTTLVYVDRAAVRSFDQNMPSAIHKAYNVDRPLYNATNNISVTRTITEA